METSEALRERPHQFILCLVYLYLLDVTESRASVLSGDTVQFVELQANSIQNELFWASPDGFI